MLLSASYPKLSYLESINLPTTGNLVDIILPCSICMSATIDTLLFWHIVGLSKFIKFNFFKFEENVNTVLNHTRMLVYEYGKSCYM